MTVVAVFVVGYALVFACGLYIGQVRYRHTLKRELRKAAELVNDEHAHIAPNLMLRELRGRRAL